MRVYQALDYFRVAPTPDLVAQLINANGCFRRVTKHFHSLRRISG